MNNIARVRNMFTKKLFILLLMIPVMLLSIPGCGGGAGGAPSLPIKAQLSFSEPPILGKTVQLTATFNLVTQVREIAHDVDAEIILSEGFELVDGDTEWKGDFIRGQSYTISATVKAVKTGTWKIGARARYSPGEGAHEGGFKALYVTVTEESATISDRPPFEVPTPVPAPPPNTDRSSPSAPSQPVKAQLSFSEPPILGKTVQLTATFNIREGYNHDAPDMTSRIILPEGFEKIDGDLEWKGDIIRGNTYTMSATVKAVKTGTWEIWAKTNSSRYDGVGGGKQLWAKVTETGATVSDRPPHEPPPTAVPAPPPPGYPSHTK